MMMGRGGAGRNGPSPLVGNSESSMIFRTTDSARQPGNVTEEALEVEPIHKPWGTWAVAYYLI